MNRLSQWLKESFFCIPSVVQPPSYSVVISAESINQINKASSDTSQRNNKITSPVSVLMNHCRPYTVFGFIVSFVSDSLDAPPNLSWSHVLKEVSKRISPSLANLNAAASVILIVFLFGVCASGNESSPDSICSSPVSTTGLPVLDVYLESDAATGFYHSTPDRLISGNDFFSALAVKVTPVFNRSILNRLWIGRAVESKTCVFFSGGECFESHNGADFTVVFSGGRSATTGAHRDYES